MLQASFAFSIYGKPTIDNWYNGHGGTKIGACARLFYLTLYVSVTGITPYAPKPLTASKIDSSAQSMPRQTHHHHNKTTHRTDPGHKYIHIIYIYIQG